MTDTVQQPAADPEPWDLPTALYQLAVADRVVERLGVSGTAPAIQAAAQRACEAYQARDLAGVRSAVAELVAAARAMTGVPVTSAA